MGVAWLWTELLVGSRSKARNGVLCGAVPTAGAAFAALAAALAAAATAAAALAAALAAIAAIAAIAAPVPALAAGRALHAPEVLLLYVFFRPRLRLR